MHQELNVQNGLNPLMQIVYLIPEANFRSEQKILAMKGWHDRNLIRYVKKNKNDKIHKNEAQDIRWSDEYWQV